MAKVVPVHIQGGKTRLMEVDENVQMPDVATQHGHEGDGLQAKGWQDTATNKLLDLTEILEAVAAMVPNAFRHAAGANVDKVTLSFGIKLGGEAGIPYLTKGTAESSIGIQVECSFPKET